MSTSSLTKVSTLHVATAGPGAKAIIQAYTHAVSAADLAVEKALICGTLLSEQKSALPHGQWLPWLAKNCPEISQDTASRWMNLAESCCRATLKEIELPADVSISQLLTLPTAELDEASSAARQLLFNFVEGKTIKDALAAAIVGGDDARAKRAIAGKALGGTHARDNRKDWPKFVRRHMSDLGYALHRYDKMTDDERDQVNANLEEGLKKWPRGAVAKFSEIVKRDLKRREGKL